MRLRSLFIATAVVALTACASETPAPAPESGWVMDLRDGAAAHVQPVVEALAWRYDDDEGKPATDIWISAVALSPAQREQLLPARSGQSSDEARQPETLGLAGLLVRVDDRGNGSRQMLSFCLPEGSGVKCSGGSGLGMALVRRFDAQSIAGTFYTRDREGRLYAASFDAPLRDESSQPLPTDVQWSTDGGAAGKAWLADNQAARDGHVAILKTYAMPERAADYDQESTVKFAQRMALRKPTILSARIEGDHAFLWVRDSVAEQLSPGVIRVEMRLVDTVWRVYGVQLN